MSKKNSIIFDLDGTLIDSAISILKIVNHMREMRGFDHIEMHEIRPHLSKGGVSLVKLSLGEASMDAIDDVAWFRNLYSQHNNGKEIVYRGVFELLNGLKSRGFRLGICTNKPSNLCQKVLFDTGLNEYFDAVVSAGEELPAKPHPSAYLTCCDKLNVLPQNTVLVGDSEIDRDTAKRVGAHFILVSYGYPIGAIESIEASAVCNHSNEILDAVLRTCPGTSQMQFEELS